MTRRGERGIWQRRYCERMSCPRQGFHRSAGQEIDANIELAANMDPDLRRDGPTISLVLILRATA